MHKRIKNKKMFPVVSNFKKCLLKVGDEVKVTAGDDKGKKGKITDFDRKRGKIKIEGINMKTHFVKKTEQNDGKIEKHEGFIDVSNVQLLVGEKITRLGKNKDQKRIDVKTKKEV